MPELKPLSALDSLFLWGERPNTMMHVAGLLIFAPPEGADITYLRDLVDEALANRDVKVPWNRKLQSTGLVPTPFRSWVTDDELDLDYHVRRSALPSPGGERELGVLVSRLHSNALDMSRPPWEMHFIEGLEGGRFAIYVKIHHSLVDGYSAMKLLVASLSITAEEMDKPLFFSIGLPPRRRRTPTDAGAGLLAGVGQLAGEIASHTGSAATLGRRIAGPLLPFTKVRPELASGIRAPYCILNGRIGRNRRFATQQYSLDVLKRIGKTQDATLNDVFISIVGGGLRSFLTELDELPRKSLVAFLPVNVRAKDDGGGGNAIGAILAKVGSDIADPVERLAAVSASTAAAKHQLEGMSRQAILAYSAYLMAPTGFQALGALAGIGAGMPTNFNLCLSNVPGPADPLYLRGSRLEASYPVSIPIHSMALNITMQSYAGTVGLGFVGCRDTIPHLQRLAVATGESLTALAVAAGVEPMVGDAH
ncbi:wax ester/triacylglycerol synthase family O-acyltransferase [Conexibacter sp. DBS9H8]|uniref:WS/DGAT/MGAT family O-acyltransferase n=1 Tax=Conexibacter sp. DBS9H8 TaxID=2937801 RepID=UPI00200BDC0F|nr:wax ester/triacylglycerol synthase family O-acyltransferase [Conexibacter sp. DBS9H8]